MDELLVLTYREPVAEAEKAWAAEIDRRIDAVERGEATTVDAREALGSVARAHGLDPLPFRKTPVSR